MTTMQEEIPEGFYDAVGTNGMRETAKNGSTQLKLEFVVEPMNKKVLVYLPISDAAWPFTIEKLLATGWEEADGLNFKNLGKNKVRLLIKYETYQGKTQRKADIWTGGSAFSFTAPKGDVEERAFEAEMAKAAKRLRESKAASAAGQPDPWDLEGKKKPAGAAQAAGGPPKLDL